MSELNTFEILNRVEELMKKKGLNASAVTSELNISGSTFSDWKRGKSNPTVYTLTKLSKFFHCSFDYLAYGTPDLSADGVTLSPEQKGLLTLYGALSETSQAKAIAYIQGLYDAQNILPDNSEVISF